MFQSSVLLSCLLITCTGVDGFYKGPYSLNHPLSSGCNNIQCLELQQLANIPGLQDSMMMQDLNTIEEPTSQQSPQFLQNSNSFRSSEDSAESAANIGQFLVDIASVGAQENGIGKRNNLIDVGEHGSSTDISQRDYSTAPEPKTQIARTLEIFRATQPSCTCNHTHEELDLGPNRFPRILVSLNCSPDSCFSSFSCRRKLYSVWVLKQKESDDKVDPHAPLLSESLRADFVFQSVTITVACECSI